MNENENYVTEGKVLIDIKEYRDLCESVATLKAKKDEYWEKYYSIKPLYDAVLKKNDALVRALMERNDTPIKVEEQEGDANG